MKGKMLKTESWPDGRVWPVELTLDVGSSFPTDVYGVSGNGLSARYVRQDVVDAGEIRRLRRALREIAKNRCQFEWDEDGVAPDCECGACIATRALKGKG